MTTQLAWKNIGRNPIRSSVFIGATVLGFAMALFTLNTMKAISQQRLDDAINLQTSDLQIHRAGFMDNKEVTYTLPEAEQVIARIASLPGVAAVAKRISSNAVVASPENTIAGEIKGVVPQEESKISVLSNFLVEGEMLRPDQKLPMLISKKTADKLKVKLHSKVVVTLQAANGEITGGAFRVQGIFATPSTPFDEGTVIARYDDLKKLAGIDAPHELAIKVAAPADLAEVQKNIEDQLSDVYQIDNWQYLLPELFAFDSFINMVGVLFTIIIMLGLGFSLMNTMNMIVQERTQELGMLRAIGQGKWSVFAMLMKEAGLMMLVGAIGGILLGVLFVTLASRHGISISQGLDFLGIRPVIYPTLNVGLLMTIILLATLITLVIATFPASRALRIQPQEALKEQ